MDRLRGKVALITGGSGGIGSATARAFVSEGARVAVTDVRAEQGRLVVDGLGEGAIFVEHDVRDPAQWAQAVTAAVKAFGRLDVLVNNAGVWRPAPLAEVTVEDARLVYEVNQLGQLLGMQAVTTAIRAAGGGAIVNMSSGAGMAGFPGQIVYGATKWAVRGMTKTAAIELGGPGGIRVNSVHPGAVDTEMVAAVAHHNEHAWDNNPVPRVATADEIAALVVFLASDESGYITGAEIAIDGGLLAGPKLFDVNS
ncbi:MAG TPA: glucose 1-dehydrogenase [Jatrophihabitantaceae bacterium]|jgi:3alpha(or 20beta)-hydroxysteroid dehydrogenase